jgi:hypothetical protein
MIQSSNDTGIFLYSKEGITYGDPIYMFIYGIGLLLLIRQLKAKFPRSNNLGMQMMQEWVANLMLSGITLNNKKRLGPTLDTIPNPQTAL